jgi:predicted XRE-type DNA-binding protein
MQQANDNEDIAFERSSGNVFADLGLENADELLVKADLAHAINHVIRSHGWTQVQASEQAGLTQPQVSKIMRMRLDDFSQDRLQLALRCLGIDVEIVLHARENGGKGTLKLKVMEPAAACKS